MLCNAQRVCFSLYLQHILAATNQKKNCGRFFFQQCGKDIQKKGMIFRLIKSSNMSNREFILKAKLPPHFLTLGWIIGISLNIYGVINNLEQCSAKHPIASIFPTSK